MAFNRLATFAPNDVTVVLTQQSSGISHILSGFSEDSIVSIERNAETYSLYTGADNTNTRIYNANTSAQITVSLQQTSSSNDVLSQLYINDAASRDSTGLFSISVVDNSGRSSYFAEEAYIAVVPNSQFANSMQTRDWVIHAVRLDTYIGGNSILSAEDQGTLEQLGAVINPRWTNA
jgi:hypothetical protein